MLVQDPKWRGCEPEEVFIGTTVLCVLGTCTSLHPCSSRGCLLLGARPWHCQSSELMLPKKRSVDL